VIPQRRLLRILLVAFAAFASGCGKKGPPLPPLRPVPAAVETLVARRLGDTVRIEFALPDRNLDGTQPVDLSRVEVYGLTIDPAGREPTQAEFLSRGVLVATVDVQPPPPAGAPPPDPPDPRPRPGAVVFVDEHLTPESNVPVRFEAVGGALARPPAPSADDPGAASAMSGPARTYLALAFGSRNRPSPPSVRVPVTLREAPAVPAGATLTYSANEFALDWAPLDPDPWQPLWPVLGYLRGVNVYELAADAGALATLKPLNEAPLATSRFTVPLTAFGVERCFSARAIERRAGQTIESDLAAPLCATPVDTFPPAAPTGLAAVAEPGAISLIWNVNAEPDVAGYLVLRGEAGGATLQPVTPEPIRETTWRDTGVTAGVRYAYAVVAVDTASAPNRSAPSARVEETAR
jgi:hypothetical protein